MMTRRNMKNWFMLVASVFVIVAAVEVWGIGVASAAPATPAKPRTLRMMMAGEPNGNGPLGGFHGASRLAEPIVYNVLEPLVDYTKAGPVPRLATKWEHSADLTKWRFYLRKGVKFHNGANFTARDVVEFAKWTIEEKAVSPVYVHVPLKEAVAVDDYTVDFIFKDPQPLLLIGGRTFLIPPVALSRDNRDLYKTNPIGTGPYRFVEWNRGRHIKLARFEGYWGAKPQIDDVDIIFRQEVAVRVAALRAGEADWICDISIEDANIVPKVVRTPSPGGALLRFDEKFQKDPLFADKRLRLAVEYAIDRQALVSLQGGATLSIGQFASPGDFGFNPELKSFPYDLEKAKALVKEAGAVGKTVTFVGTTDRFAKDREVAEAIAFMIEKTGLKVKLMLMQKTEASKYWVRRAKEESYMSDIYLAGTDSLLEVEGRYSQVFVKDGKNCTLDDPEPVRLYKEVLAESNYARRGEKLAKAWAYVYEQAHYVPLFKLDFAWGTAKNLDWKIDVAGRPFIADMKFTD